MGRGGGGARSASRKLEVRAPGWNRDQAELKALGCHSPVTVPEACGLTERISPASSDFLSVPKAGAPPSRTQAGSGREAELGSMSEDLCPGVQYREWSISGITACKGEGEATHSQECRGPHCPGAAHTPYTDVHQGLAVDQTVVQGFTRLMASFFRIISMFWPCHERSGSEPDEGGWRGNRQFRDSHLCWMLLNTSKGQPAHPHPRHHLGAGCGFGLGQLLDAVIDSNTALPLYQVPSGTSTQPRELTAKHHLVEGKVTEGP